MLRKSITTAFKFGAVAFLLFIFLFAEGSLGTSSGIVGSMVREIAAVLRDPGTQWMVFLCLGIYFTAFVLIRVRSSHGLFSTIRITGRARHSVRARSGAVSSADSGTVSVRESETGGGAPPAPAGEDACATFAMDGAHGVTRPTGWLAVGVLISAIVYAFHYSPSTQALTLLAGAVIGQAFGLWGGSITPSPVGDEVTSLKSKTSQRLLTSSPTILVVLLALASVWHTVAVHTFEYHGQTRWSGPWDNPNLFGLLMGTGAALAAGFGLQRWKMEDGRFNNCSSRRKEALTAEKPALSKAYLSLLTSAATRNGIIKHALSQYVPAVFCLVAFGFMARGLFHSYSRGRGWRRRAGWDICFSIQNSEFRIQNCPGFRG